MDTCNIHSLLSTIQHSFTVSYICTLYIYIRYSWLMFVYYSYGCCMLIKRRMYHLYIFLYSAHFPVLHQFISFRPLVRLMSASPYSLLDEARLIEGWRMKEVGILVCRYTWSTIMYVAGEMEAQWCLQTLPRNSPTQYRLLLDVGLWHRWDTFISSNSISDNGVIILRRWNIWLLTSSDYAKDNSCFRIRVVDVVSSRCLEDWVGSNSSPRIVYSTLLRPHRWVCVYQC